MYTGDSIKKDYYAVIGTSNKEDMNEKQRRVLSSIETLVNMYNDECIKLAEAKELVYKLTAERIRPRERD